MAVVPERKDTAAKAPFPEAVVRVAVPPVTRPEKDPTLLGHVPLLCILSLLNQDTMPKLVGDTGVCPKAPERAPSTSRRNHLPTAP